MRSFGAAAALERARPHDVSAAFLEFVRYFPAKLAAGTATFTMLALAADAFYVRLRGGEVPKSLAGLHRVLGSGAAGRREDRP